MADRDDQRRLTWIATVSALMVVSAFLAAKAARDAILLTRFSIHSLPLFIGISAALSLPVIIIAGRLMMRYGPHRLVPALNALSGLAALGEWLLIGQYPRPIAVVVYLHLNVASAVLVSGFWSIVNERFDIHSAKRHIGRIGMGATLGGILGGVIAERTSAYFAPDAILLVLAAMQVICAGMLFVFGRGAGRRTDAHAAVSEPTSTWSALNSVVRSSLLRKAGTIVILTAIGAGVLDYVFKADMVGGQGSKPLLGSLAVFYTVTNVITAVVQLTLSGAILNKLGVPRTVASLPYTITGFGVLAMIARVPLSVTIARGAELVTRNSVYRSGYELLYAPLPTDHKRPTKVLLDVGADKVGDILSAQLVGAIVFLASDVRMTLLVLATAIGALSIVIAMRVPRSYTKALETSLLDAAADLPKEGEPTAEPWVSLTGMPSFGDPADVVPLKLRRRQRAPRLATPLAATPTPLQPPKASNRTDDLIQLLRELRSGDAARIRTALGKPLPTELASIAIELVGGADEVALAAVQTLRTAAPRCTGLLVDAMLDRTRDTTMRRRLIATVSGGEPRLAAWGLWRTLSDPDFEIRYRAGAMLAPLALDGHLAGIPTEDVFEHVRKELGSGRDEWRTRKLITDAVIDGGAETAETDIALAHVFRVLGLALPAEPLRVALHAVQTDDAGLRGMALEYLESVLPPDVHAQLWPLLDEHADLAPRVEPATEGRSKELLAKLKLSYDTLFEKAKAKQGAS